MRKKLLFISHEASRTGAPILLLNIIKELIDDFEIDILFLEKGEIIQDFENLKIHIINPEQFQKKYSVYNRIKSKVNNHVFFSKSELFNQCIGYIDQQNYEIIIGNTIASLNILLKIAQFNKKIALYCHELTFSLESFYSKEELVKSLNTLPLILAGSDSVKNNLISNYKVDNDKVLSLPSFIDHNDHTVTKSADELRLELGISKNSIIFGTMSSHELRKGIDLLPAITRNLVILKSNLDFRIISIGGSNQNPFTRQLHLDSQKLNIEDKIIFIEKTKHPNDFMNLFDVFLLPSREDPFPLVMHLAAAFQKPIIAFKKSGGIEEVLDEKELVDYLNIDEYCKAMVDLAENQEKRMIIGSRLHNKIITNYSKDIVINKLKTIIQNSAIT